jgi:RNA polymerase sporulation-specific sigma factor
MGMLGDYVRELQKQALLRPEEEVRLWRAFKRDGCLRSRATLIESYQPLVFKVATQLRLREGLLMDMIQEGTVGLIEAVERYDHERTVRFSTFATYRIRGRMLNALERERRAGAERAGEADVAAADGVADPGAADRFGDVEDALLVEQIVKAIARLPERDRRIVRALIYKEEPPRRLAGDLRISLSHLYRLHHQLVQRLQSHVAPAASEGRAAG